MEIDTRFFEKVWNKIIEFIDREVGFTLLFWLAAFLIVLVLKTLGLVKM